MQRDRLRKFSSKIAGDNAIRETESGIKVEVQGAKRKTKDYQTFWIRSTTPVKPGVPEPVG